jgi:hypothetical protein
MTKTRRVRLTVAAMMVLTAAAAIAPASASALAVTVTGDDGNPLALGAGLTIRNMNPTVGIGFTAGEDIQYAATITGPDGVNAAGSISCLGVGTSRIVDYRGNGAYTVTIQPYGASDRSCRTPVGSPSVYTFTINAGVTLGRLDRRVLIRAANSFTPLPVELPFTPNPGALGYEVRYAKGGAVGPDGALTGASAEGTVNATTGRAELRITSPGRYAVVARARGFTGATGQFFTPWTAPVTVRAVAPFDLQSARFIDENGPVYRVSIKLREPTARGRVRLAWARGTTGGRFRGLGTARLSSKGSFVKSLRISRTGVYRLRVGFRGSRTVASGRIVQQFRVSRQVGFEP